MVLQALHAMLDESDRPRRAHALRDMSFGSGGLVDDLSPQDWERFRERAYEGRGG